MTYTPDPTNINEPTSGISAGTAYQEFQVLKEYIQQGPAGLQKFKNLLVNGAMNIDQINQGNSAYTVSAGSILFTLDQWQVGYLVGSGSLTVQQNKQVNGPGGAVGIYACGISITCSSTVVGFSLYQNIEAARCQQLQSGTTVVLSFWVYTTSTGITVTPALYTNSTKNGGVNYAACTPVAVTINGTGFQFVSQTIVLTQGCQNTLTVDLPFNGTGGKSIVVTQVQLEVNNFATQFEQLPPAIDLLLCQRYLYVYDYIDTFYSGGGMTAKYNTMPITTYMFVTATTEGTVLNTVASINVSSVTFNFYPDTLNCNVTLNCTTGVLCEWNGLVALKAQY